jgi:hypothetical protein
MSDKIVEQNPPRSEWKSPLSDSSENPVPYGGCPVMVWGCISHDCKLNLVTIQGSLTGDQYIRDVLQPVVAPHFDNHPLATRHLGIHHKEQLAGCSLGNTDPSKCINDHTLRSDTEFCRTSLLKLSEQSRDWCSLASHEPGFVSDRAYLGHVRPSYTCSRTFYAKHWSVGSSIALGMAAAITTGHPTCNWRDETQGRWGLAFSSIYTGLVASGWLSKWGITTGCKMSLMYWSPVRLPCMVT